MRCSACAYILALAVATSVQGCILVPFINAFKQTGVTPEDRRALLPAEVKKFSDALVWGSRQSALETVASESKEGVSKELRGLGEDEHIVESKIDDVEWNDSSFEAKVFVKFKYYKVPYYVVKTRTEEQQWVFYVGTGWKLKDRTRVDEG